MDSQGAMGEQLRGLVLEFMELTDLPYAYAIKCFATRNFSSFHVAHLKAILKRYKHRQSAMEIRLDRNKAALIDQLKQLSDLVDAGPLTPALGPQAGQGGGQSSSQNQYQAHNQYKPAAYKPAAQQAPRPMYQQSSKKQKTGHASAMEHPSAHDDVQHGSSSNANNRHPGIAGMLIPPVDQAKRNRVLNTKEKKEVWAILKEQKYPFSDDEMLDEIALCPPHELDATTILMAIIMKRSAKEQQKALALEKQEQALQEQEDRDMDAAILNSESERDVMANRDKRRVHQLMWDHTCGIVDAEEFKNSFLLTVPRLAGSKAEKHSLYDGENENIFMEAIAYFDQMAAMAELQRRHKEGKDKEGKESKAKSSTNMNGSNESKDKSAINWGDEGDEEDGEWEEWDEASEEEEAPPPEISTVLPLYKPVLGPMHNNLRAHLVKLLLLEKEAKKFHKEDSEQYLHALAKRLEQELRTACPQGLDMLVVDNEGNSPPDSAMNQFDRMLQREVAILEPALYQLPPDGGHLPMIFRDGVQDYHIQEDGFEVMATETEAVSRVPTDADSDFSSDEEDAFFSKFKKN